ncbi:MAG: putative toxin-antitoxin system toxin component, PIN family [Betaproteobacteria bacterium]|nr:putative toxin-antitoxin system toxin component, PIN family [Betaproteobacteria bacterium]
MRAEPGARVVIDTNVWISAFLKKSGTPASLVRQVVARGRPVFSSPTFAELEARLWKPKFDRYLGMDDRTALLNDASALSHWVEVPPEIAAQAFCRDADDDKFIHAALAAKAPWLVTGDQDLLDLPPLPHLRILSPADALQFPEFCA